MKLLILNDDGFLAYGISALAEILSENHQVVMVAPETEQSACSHRITIHKPISYRQVQSVPFPIYAVNGTPADCARFGLLGRLDDFDFVLSGINHGSNIGLDMLYSGTFSAAREASLLGSKAIALSAPIRNPQSKAAFYDYVHWLETFLADGVASFFTKENGSILNINFPKQINKHTKYLKTFPEPQHYQHEFLRSYDSFTCSIVMNLTAKLKGSDYDSILNQNISISIHSII